MSRTIARQAYPAVLAGMLLLSSGVPQADAASAVVKDLRVGEHPGATRVVLDLSQRTNAKFDVSPDGRTLFVVLPDADWRAGPFAAKHAKGMLTDFRQSANGGGVELSLLLDTPVRMKPPFFVSPESGYGERIVVDLVPDPTLARTAASAARPAAQGLQPGLQYARADESNMLPPSDVAVERSQAARAVNVAPAAQPARLEVAQNYALSPNRSSAVAMPPMQAQAQAPMPANAQPAMSDRMGGGFLYVKLGTGLGTIEEATADGSGSAAEIETEFGWLVNGGVGVDLKNGFRLEGEMLYATNDAKTITGTVAGTTVNSAADGSTSLLGFMANAAYDFKTPYAITPFVFGGLGLGIVSLNDVHGTSGSSLDSSDAVFAMQAGAGVSTDLSPNLALEASYRYFETTDPELTNANGGPFTYEYMSHMFMMGMRYKF